MRKMFKPFKRALNFNVEYHGTCIPKNAIYGRFTKNVYVYIDDYKQFKNKPKLVKMHIMDVRKESTFKARLVKPDNPIFEIANEYITVHNLFDMKCENVLCLKRANVGPKDRTVGTYTYNARGRDNSQNAITDGIKYREYTEEAYHVGKKSSMIASSTRPEIDKNYDGRRDAIDMQHYHTKYALAVITA